jgi:uncharacterized protein with HEPN domain
MTRDQQRFTDYLSHTPEAIERIHIDMENGDEAAFLQIGMAQDAIILNLEIIGEAHHSIESHFPGFSSTHLELPLAFAYHISPWLLQG